MLRRRSWLFCCYFLPVLKFEVVLRNFVLPLHHLFLRGNPGVCHAMAGTGFM